MGETHRRTVHVACPCGAQHAVEVIAAVDAQSDPALARRLLEGDPMFNAWGCPLLRERWRLDVPVVYHDPVNGLFILVLPEAYRARDLHERAALLALLAEDTAHAVPPYAVHFAVAFGPDGLRRRIEAEAARAARRGRRATTTGEHARAAAESVTTVAAAPAQPAPVARQASAANGCGDALGVEAGRGDEMSDDAAAPAAAIAATEPTAAGAAPPEPSPDVWPGGADPIVRRARADGTIELRVRAGLAEREALESDALEVRVQLHRMPTAPLVALALGSPGALAGAPGAGAPVWVLFDVSAEGDRSILQALGRSFEMELFVHDREDGDRLARRRQIVAPLADNARAALSAAADSLKHIPAGDRSFARAVTAFLAPDHDRLGTGATYTQDLDEDALAQLGTPPQVWRAMRVVRRLSDVAGEDWLILTRGFSLARWQSMRRAAVERAVELGFWAGPVAAQIAVGEGLARSRKELVTRLQRSFGALLTGGAHGLEDGAIAENWEALKTEAMALGLSSSEWTAARSEPIVSETDPVTSGTIGASSAAGGATAAGVSRPEGGRRDAHLSDEALRAQLGQREKRMGAAVELAHRGNPESIEAVFAVVESMSRAEAVRVLASVIGFGRAAEPHLCRALRSVKGFVRQGSALALAVLGGGQGIDAICDLLLDEPTEIWREVARAVGETGEAAVEPLVDRLTDRPERARERAAWALAYVAAHGALSAVEALAAGDEEIGGGVARHALELVDLARSDQLMVRGDGDPRDQTVNRAFSRQFFAAVAGTPSPRDGGSLDGSSPAIHLDESDVLEAMDVEAQAAELDEGDLLPT